MPHDSHIVRFKVLRVDCAAMPDGQQYTIFYRRGDTGRSTPCYVAHHGSVDFSAMPEGAAVIHFKTGHAGRRFAPKYIQLRIEEYTRGVPRRLVGETEVDCGEVLSYGEVSGAGVLPVHFRMYGTAAELQVAVLVYPSKDAPLSFDGLVAAPRGSDAPPRNRHAPAHPRSTATAVEGGSGRRTRQPPPSSLSDADTPTEGTVKAMTRGEALTLLITLETLLERRRSQDDKHDDNGNDGGDGDGDAAAAAGGGGGFARDGDERRGGAKTVLSKLELRVRELEARRRALTATEGLATTVATVRCQEVVAAQFSALARRHRNNFVGETAAYLRQMALTSGAALDHYSDDDDDDDGGDEDDDEVDEKKTKKKKDGNAEEKEGEGGAVGGKGSGSRNLAGPVATAREAQLRDQLKRSERRMQELQMQQSALEKACAALANLQSDGGGGVDVNAEVNAHLDKIATLQAQLEMLRRSREAVMTALHERPPTSPASATTTAAAARRHGGEDGRGARSATPLAREVASIRQRIRELTREQAQLRATVQHMTSVAAGHIVTWARGKNPPSADVVSHPRGAVAGGVGGGIAMDDFFATSTTEKSKDNDDDDAAAAAAGQAREGKMHDRKHRKEAGKGDGTRLDASQQRQVVAAFAHIGAAAATPAGRRAKTTDAASPRSASSSTTSSSASSSGHRTPRDLFSDVHDLPSMGDFGGQKSKQVAATSLPAPSHAKTTTAAAATAAAATTTATSGLVPGGLGVDMFAPTAETSRGDVHGATPQPRPDSSNRHNSSGHLTGAAAMAPPVTSISAPAMFEITPAATAGAATTTTTAPAAAYGGFGFGGDAATASASTAGVVGRQADVSGQRRRDDPFYDEMDDFTVHTDAAGGAAGGGGGGNTGAVIEFTEDFGKFGLFGDTAAGGGGGGGHDAAASVSGGGGRGGGASTAATPAAAATAAPARPTFDFGPSSGGNSQPQHHHDDDDNATAPVVSFEAVPAISFDDAATSANAAALTQQSQQQPGRYGAYRNLPQYDFGSDNR